MERLPAWRVDEYIAFFEIHPMPDPHFDAALICSVIANANRSKGGRAFRPADFLPRGPGEDQQTPGEMMAMLDMVGKEEA